MRGDTSTRADCGWQLMAVYHLERRLYGNRAMVAPRCVARPISNPLLGRTLKSITITKRREPTTAGLAIRFPISLFVIEANGRGRCGSTRTNGFSSRLFGCGFLQCIGCIYVTARRTRLPVRFDTRSTQLWRTRLLDELLRDQWKPEINTTQCDCLPRG